MKAPTTIKGVAALLEALVADNSGVTVDRVDITPWGVKAGFSIDGVSIDADDVVSGARVRAVHVGEEDFVTTDVVRFDVDACNEDDEETPAAIIVGTHSSGESSDEDYCASLYGEIFLLNHDGDAEEWRIEATREHDQVMRKCIVSTMQALVAMMSKTSEAALKAVVNDNAVRDMMRRLAAAA